MSQRRMQLDIDLIRARKPARRIVEMPETVKQALSEGFVPTMNLTEWLASDRQTLLSTVLRAIDGSLASESQSLWTPELLSQSALKQSFAIGKWLSARFKIGDDVWRRLSTHESDMVREWSAIMIGLADNITFARKLAWIKPFADDEHSGLREIAWLSLRQSVLQNPVQSIQCVPSKSFTASGQQNIPTNPRPEALRLKVPEGITVSCELKSSCPSCPSMFIHFVR